MFSNYYCIFLSVILKSLVLIIFLLLTVASFTVLEKNLMSQPKAPADNSASSESSDNSSGKGF